MGDAQRYQIQKVIAAGGMAEVYLGESAGIEGFRKKVAIKRVLPKLSANQEFINMFLDEARLCAYLSHSKCVQVFDIGQGAGSHFIVMEYVDGADLKGVLDHLSTQKKAMQVEVACLIAMQICEGLAYAHQARDHHGNPLRIVHRDISPHNVLITTFGEVKLVDFGLAKASSHLADEDEDIVKGKFGYLAPEITLRQSVDHRVDIFAVGILLYEMLAGQRLFLGETDLETFKQVQAARVPDLRRVRADVDDPLMFVLLKALAKDRDQRYQNANELARDLAKVLFGRQHPVTYEDIAAVVQSTQEAQQKTAKKSARKAEVVIGELILDALHGFSGDTEELINEVVDRPSGHAPLSVKGSVASYEDPSAWGLGDEFGDMFDDPQSDPPPASGASVRPPPGAGSHPSLAPSSAQAAPRTSRRPPPSPARSRTAAEKSKGTPNSGTWWRRWFD
jgi:serine/threonine-protein kinase